MKTTIKNLCLAIVLVFAFSCKDEISLFKGENGIYFAVEHQDLSIINNHKQAAFFPYSYISLANVRAKDTIVKLKIKVLGEITSVDRFFDLEIDEDNTNAVKDIDYKIVNDQYCVMADSNYADISIHIFRTANILDSYRTISLNLIANDYFSTPINVWQADASQNKWYIDKYIADIFKRDITDEDNITDDKENVIDVNDDAYALFNNNVSYKHTIVFDNKIVKPEGWLDSYFGDFSVAKYKLMADLYSLSMGDFTLRKMNYVRAKYIAVKFKYYLADKHNAGEDVLEDDGKLMSVGIKLN